MLVTIYYLKTTEEWIKIEDFCVGPQSQAEQKDVAYTLKQFGQTWALLLLSYTGFIVV